MEIITLYTFFLSIATGFILTMVYEWANKKYHLHHSLFGIGFLIIAGLLLLFNPSRDTIVYILIGLAIGNITEHTLAEKNFAFVEKKGVKKGTKKPKR